MDGGCSAFPQVGGVWKVVQGGAIAASCIWGIVRGEVQQLEKLLEKLQKRPLETSASWALKQVGKLQLRLRKLLLPIQLRWKRAGRWEITNDFLWTAWAPVCNCGAEVLPNLSRVSSSAPWVMLMFTEKMWEGFGKSAKRRASGTEVISFKFLHSADVHIISPWNGRFVIGAT